MDTLNNTSPETWSALWISVSVIAGGLCSVIWFIKN